MRRFLSLLVIFVCTIGLIATQAEARRFGGARSFGMQRNVSSFSRPSPVQSAAQPRASANRWLAPLAGMAIGGMLASLFMGNGLASGLLSWLMVAGVALLALNLWRGRKQTRPAYEQLTRDTSAYFSADQQNQYSTRHNHSNAAIYPSNTAVDSFLRDAKVQFIRLQAAYDQKNLDDIRQFTAPEVFAEIQLQFSERGNLENHTEVVSLEAKLLDTSTESGNTVHSVNFTGLIREDRDNPPVSLDEIWHFQKFNDNSQWVVTGIQQN